MTWYFPFLSKKFLYKLLLKKFKLLKHKNLKGVNLKVINSNYQQQKDFSHSHVALALGLITINVDSVRVFL